ncbi:MAG: archaemetzincin family Zn-dependent metalloprotease [Desulfamplus sp.]|nr:archaemetzincin family Zn-dependent metalloprotease [Desulfamplus sp.]MBF0257291.1 archaemetzincin family Zn-dependent metalloprotease [Desulfamplus sp.]
MNNTIGKLPFILVSPTEGIDPALAENISEAVGDFFGYPVKVSPLLQNIDFAFNSDRNQYNSTIILASLADLAPERCLKILAITDKDLFIPILTHVYGEAQLNGIACIVSINRLNTDLQLSKKKVFERIIKESIHELGHTFNLRHCKDHSCIMHYCRSLDDVDLKSNQYCRYCEVLLSDAIISLSRDPIS